MTDSLPLCPGCGRDVGRFAHYVFEVMENRRWHGDCYRRRNRQPEDEQQDAGRETGR